MQDSSTAAVPRAQPRRHWLLRALQASIGITGAAIFYPAVRFLWPRAATSSGSLEVVAPYRVNDLKPDAEGHWPAPFNFGGKPCLVICTPDGLSQIRPGVPTPDTFFKAFNAVCTHVECTVEYRPEKADIFCNCHNGVYDLNGHNVAGPPPRPLETYKVTLRGKPGQEEIVVSRST